jgi:hypothetical protein
MTSKAIFKAMKRNASASVAFYIPRQGRGGAVGLVPGHIRCCSDNSLRVMTEIEQFRRMGQERQNVGTRNWKAMTPNAHNVHKERIAQLEVTQGDLNLGIET